MKRYEVQMIGIFFILITTITAQAAYLGTSRLGSQMPRVSAFGNRTLFDSWRNTSNPKQLPADAKSSGVRLGDLPAGIYVNREEIDKATKYVPSGYYRGIRSKENPPGIAGIYNPKGIVPLIGATRGYGIGSEEDLYVLENPSRKEGKPHLIRIVQDPTSGKVYREEVYTNASLNHIEKIAKEYLERQDKRLKQLREQTISTLPYIPSQEHANSLVKGTFADIVDKTKKYLKELSKETIENFKDSVRRIRRALYGPEE